jgi:uncharacterized membrane protein
MPRWNSDDWNDWSAIVVLTLLSVFIAFALLCTFELEENRKVHPAIGGVGKVIIYSMSLGMVGIHYYLLVQKKMWLQFKREFDHHSKPARIAGRATVWVLFFSLFLLIVGYLGPATKHLLR